MKAHHVVDETSEEAPAAEVGVVGLKVGSLRARHLLESSSSSSGKRTLVSTVDVLESA